MALPSGYTQLKYIQSSGTQYINTMFKPSGNALRVVMKFRYTAAYSGLSLFGNHTSTPYSLTVYGTRPTFWVGNSSDVSCGPQTEQGVDYTLDATAENGTITAYWNGVKYTASYSGSLYTEQPIFIFGGNSNGALAEAGNGYQLEMFQLYDGGALVRDYVPAENSAGAVGLYDAANGVFYANAGSGAFEAGPVATGAVDGNGATIIAGVSFSIKEGKAMLNGAARKITEGMTKVNGAVKKIALAAGIDVAALAISYSGAYTDQKEVVMSGKTYRLLTLTGSGTLTLPQEITADVWLCAGGNGGASGGRGGGGGLFSAKNKVAIDGSVVCTIGSGGSAATVGNATAFGASSISNGSNYYNGASGGGSGGTGGGATTVPFGSSDYFSPHSAGGGGGGSSARYTNGNTVHYLGGAGGSNGANGAASKKASGWPSTKVAGGNLGGGAGGTYDGNRPTAGSNATYYGSGGGGGGSYENEKTGSIRRGGGGAGYQGVIYVRIPYEQ